MKAGSVTDEPKNDETVEPDEVETDEQVDEPAVEAPPKDQVRIWTLIVLILMAVLLGWYLMADRLTPHTSQARVRAQVVPIAPLISGLVEEVYVTNNQRVAAGDPLFRLNTDDYDLILAAAEADLESARQAVGASTAAVAAAEASVRAAEANRLRAEQDAIRLRGIRAEDPGAISERRLQYAEASLTAAAANVEAAEANLEKAKQDLGRTGDQNFRILQAQASMADATLNIERSTILAPSDGVVTDVRLDIGNFAASGQAQMTFIATEDLWIQADFTENNLGHIAAGNRVHILFDALPGRLFEGSVRGTGFGVKIDTAAMGELPTIDNDKNWLREAQRFPVLVDVEATDVRALGVRVGSQATVTVYTGDHPFLNTLARWRIRIASYLSYAY
jgi:multidrug resistance efflux pump